MFSAMPGDGNDVAIGYQALYKDTGSGYNTAIGANAMKNATPSIGYDVAIGYEALKDDTAYGYNIAIGPYAMKNANPGDGQDIAIGYQALYKDTGIGYNTAIGANAMLNANPGDGNDIAIGYQALFNDTGPGYNTAIGSYAMFNATPTYGNDVAIGYQALFNDTGSGYNTAIGSQSYIDLTTGSYNVGIGYGSGVGIISGVSNSISIGAFSAAQLSNTAVFPLNVNVGINTFTPRSTLEVQGNVYASNALSTTNITAAGFTSNVTNTTFFYDTLTIPLILANRINVGTGQSITALQANFQIEQSNVFIGNSAVVGPVSSTSANPNNSMLLFDNSTMTNPSVSVAGTPNKIIFHSNTGTTCGIGVMSPSLYGPVTTYLGRSGHNFYTGTIGSLAHQMAISSGGLFGFAGTASIGSVNTQLLYRLQLTAPTPATSSNVTLRIESSNICMTTGPSYAGFGTQTPSANIHVVGNVFVSNALTTKNVFASNILQVGTGTIGSNIALFSNIGGGSNVVVINSNAFVGISNLAPATALSVGGTISSLGNATTYGTVAPLTWRQGTQNSTDWSVGAGILANYSLATSQVQIQCGSITATSTTQSVTFPSPYINKPIVMVTPYASTTLYVSAVSTTTFVVSAPTIVPFKWMSIGI
jgi:hypothetical protein